MPRAEQATSFREPPKTKKVTPPPASRRAPITGPLGTVFAPPPRTLPPGQIEQKKRVARALVAPREENLAKYGFQTAAAVENVKQDREDAKRVLLEGRGRTLPVAPTSTLPSRVQQTDLIFERGGHLAHRAMSQGFRSDDSFKPFEHGQKPVGRLWTPDGVVSIYRRPDPSTGWDPYTELTSAQLADAARQRRQALGTTAVIARGVAGAAGTLSGLTPLAGAIREEHWKSAAVQAALFAVPGGKGLEAVKSAAELTRGARTARAAGHILGAERDAFATSMREAARSKVEATQAIQHADIFVHDRVKHLPPAERAAAAQALFTGLRGDPAASALTVSSAHAIPKGEPYSLEPLNAHHGTKVDALKAAQGKYDAARAALKEAEAAAPTKPKGLRTREQKDAWAATLRPKQRKAHVVRENANDAFNKAKRELGAASNDELYTRAGIQSGITPESMAESPHFGSRQDLAAALHEAHVGKRGALSDSMDSTLNMHRVIALADHLATQGEWGRHWYEQSAAAIKELARGDVNRAEKLAQLVAIYSPQQPILGNTSLAFRAYNEFLQNTERGVSWDRAITTGTPDQAKKAMKVLANKGDWAGRKTNNFYVNFLEDINKPKFDDMVRRGEIKASGVTADLWMARAFGYKTDALANKRYDIIEQITQALAAERGWKPKHVQAAIWTAIKDISKDRSANIDFATGIERHLAQINYKAGVGIDPVLRAAYDTWAPEIQQAFLHAKSGLVDGFTDEVGLLSTPSAFEPRGGRLQVGTSAAPRGVKGKVEYRLREDERNLLTVTSSAIARALKAESAAWVRPFKPLKKPAEDMIKVRLGRDATDEEASGLASALGSDFAVIHTDGGLLIKQTGDNPLPVTAQKGESFHTVVADTVGRLIPDDLELIGYAHDGELATAADYASHVASAFGNRRGSGEGLRFTEAADRLSRDAERVDRAFLADPERAAAVLTDPERAAVGQSVLGGPGRPDVRFTESSEPQHVQRFVDAVAANPRAEFLTPYTAEDLANHRVFLSDDGHTGYALSPDGDLVNVFRNPGGVPGSGRAAVEHAIGNGARTLDAFSGFLSDLYEQLGFVKTGRVPWDDAQAPPGWDYATYGRPDVVFMARGAKGKERRFADWNVAKQDSRARLAEAERALGGQIQRHDPHGLAHGLTPEPPPLREAARELPSGGLPPEAASVEAAPVEAAPAVAEEPSGYVPRTLRYGELTQRFPKARSPITRNVIARPADWLSEVLQESERATRTPVLRRATTGERVSKAAGRAQRFEQARNIAPFKKYLDVLKDVKAGSREDVANFWFAQLPRDYRNARGLQLVRGKQADELKYVLDPEGALADLNNNVRAIKAKLGAARRSGDLPGAEGVIEPDDEIHKLLQDLEDAKIEITDLPQQAQDISASIARLDGLIADPPLADERVIESIRALSQERASVLTDSGRLNPEIAAEREGLVSRWLGLEPTGEESYLGHRLVLPERSRYPFTPQGGTGRVALPKGMSENKMILAKRGRLRESTHVAAEDFGSAQVFRQALNARNDLGAMGTPFKGHMPEGSILVNPKGRTIPPHWKTDELAQFKDGYEDIDTVRRKAEEIVGEFSARGDDKAAVTRLKEAATEQGIDWSELRVVPSRLVDRYYSQYRPLRARGGPTKAYDTMVDVAATSIIFGRLGYIPKNVVQNLAMAVPHQGAFLPANAVWAAQVARDPELRHLALAEIGHTGATGAIGKEAFSQKLGKVAGFVSKAADDPVRLTALMHEIRAEHIIPKTHVMLTPDDRRRLIRFFTSKGDRAQLDDVRARAVDSMADFTRMTPDQARIARRFLIIPGWLMAGTRYPFYFAANYPLRTALMAYAAAGEPGAPDALQFNRPLDEYFTGTASYLRGLDIGGRRLRLGSLSPVSMPFELAATARGTVTGRKGPFDYSTPTAFDYANPLAAAIIAMTQGQGIGRSALKVAPNVALIRALIQAKDSPTYPGDKSRIERLLRELGVVPIRVNDAGKTKTGGVGWGSGGSSGGGSWGSGGGSSSGSWGH